MANSYEERKRGLEHEDLIADNLPIIEIGEFCRTNSISLKELDTAYLISLGLPAGELSAENQPIREEVFGLAKMIDVYTRGGYPLTRILQFIEGRSVYEHLPKHFEDIVGRLDVSDREKELLKAVMRKERDGILCIYTKGQKRKLAHFSATGSKEDKDYTSNDAALELLRILSQVLKEAGKEGIEITLES